MKIFPNTVKDLTSTVDERNKFDEIMIWPLFIQAILGQQVLNPKWYWKSHIFAQVVIIGLIIYVFFGTADFLEKATDVASKGEAYYTFLVTFVFLAEYLTFISNRVAFRKVYLIAKTTIFQMVINISTEKANDMMKKLQRIVNLFVGAILLPIVMYVLVAIWSNSHGERATLSKTTTILMPMTSPYYEIGFMLHAVFLFIVTFTIYLIDMWFAVVIFLFCVASDCVVMLLQVEPKTENETVLAYGVRLNESLRNFYGHHQKLMGYLNSLRDMYKWPTLVPLIGAVFESCASMFLITEKLQWSFVTNVIPVLIITFAYNWLGEQVQTKGTELNMALLQFDWQNLQPADKKKYLLIVTYTMKKDVAVRTASGKDLSLSTMADILKASYQVFTLLKTMKN